MCLETNKIYNMDCIEGMKLIEANSIDSIVTDPPYELGFMGKSWDNSGIAYNLEMWTEALRILKPGGFLLAFGGTRTYHRMACAIEDAGFEIRDQMQWIYGGGFPKSLNIGKAIDKNNGKYLVDYNEFGEYVKKCRENRGYSKSELDKLLGTNTAVAWWEGRNYLGKFEIQLPSFENYKKLKKLLNMDDRFGKLIQWEEAKREVIGKGKAGLTSGNICNFAGTSEFDLTAPATDQSKKYEGWGTALKPANEPICVARKPLGEKTVAANVLKYGTGGINIDDCRIGVGSNGRFPANIILDEAAGKILDEQSGIKQSQIRTSKYNNNTYSDKGGASRFFYCAKTSKKERNQGLEGFEEKQTDESRKEGNPGGDNPRNRGVNKVKNTHPTLKPVKLMEYLVRLVTPKGGTVLDPFIGSGTTGMAAKGQGFNYIGFDMTPEYCEIAEARIKSVEKDKQTKLI